MKVAPIWHDLYAVFFSCYQRECGKRIKSTQSETASCVIFDNKCLVFEGGKYTRVLGFVDNFSKRLSWLGSITPRTCWPLSTVNLYGVLIRCMSATTFAVHSDIYKKKRLPDSPKEEKKKQRCDYQFLESQQQIVK